MWGTFSALLSINSHTAAVPIQWESICKSGKLKLKANLLSTHLLYFDGCFWIVCFFFHNLNHFFKNNTIYWIFSLNTLIQFDSKWMLTTTQKKYVYFFHFMLFSGNVSNKLPITMKLFHSVYFAAYLDKYRFC